MVLQPNTRASSLIAMACNLIAMASNLIALASNLIAMASNLMAVASRIFRFLPSAAAETCFQLLPGCQGPYSALEQNCNSQQYPLHMLLFFDAHCGF